MAKLTPKEQLAIYRPNLVKYEAEGSDMAVTQRKLIERLEREIAAAPTP